MSDIATATAAVLVFLHAVGPFSAWLQARRTRTAAPPGYSWLAAPVVFAALVALARLTTPVAPDAVAQLGLVPPPDLETLHEFGRRLIQAFVPIPELSPTDGRWWNSNILLPDFERLTYVGPDERATSGAFAAFGYIILLGWVAALRSHRAAVIALLAGFAGILGLFVRLPVHAVRYEGHLVLCLLVVTSMVAAQRPAWLRDRLASGMFAFTFGAGVIATMVALYADATGPFSQSRHLARYLERPDARGLPVVGFEYYRLSPVAAYVGHEFYSPELGRVISHGIWSLRWHGPDYQSAPRAVLRRGICWALAQSERGTPVLLVSTNPLILSPAMATRMKLEASFLGSQAFENYWVYRVRAGGETDVPCGERPAQ